MKKLYRRNSLAQGRLLSLSDEHYKDGSRSLRWTYKPGAVLSLKKDLKFEAKDPTGKDTYLSAFIVWVYNEKAVDKKITFQFFEGWKGMYIFSLRHKLHRMARGMGLL